MFTTIQSNIFKIEFVVARITGKKTARKSCFSLNVADGQKEIIE